jgi:hypothetical protein
VKKALAAILLLVYATVSSGFTMNLHYCMDRFQSWDLGKTKEKCGLCGMKVKKSNGCCRDEVKVVKLQQDVLGATAIVYAMQAPVLATTPFFFTAGVAGIYSQPVSTPPAHGPPLIDRQDTYLRNCVFRV